MLNFNYNRFIGLIIMLAFISPTVCTSQPTNFDKYKTIWHNSPVEQGYTGTCWSFASTSFAESEIKRIKNVEVKLSEMFTVYWEYVDRAIDYNKTRGNTYYNQGSKIISINYIYKKYGAVPFSTYQGKLSSNGKYNHDELIKQLKAYLKDVMRNEAWDEKEVVKNIKSILNNEIGEPPTSISIGDKTFTPLKFLNDYCGFKLNEYFSFVSQTTTPYYEHADVFEEDNWRHDKSYYNIPLKDFFEIITKSVENDYSVCICGDVSEQYYWNKEKIADIPKADIPSDYIDEFARQFRIDNGATSSGHCLHLVGYQIIDGKYWFLIKDSNKTQGDNNHTGYRFFSEDYIKLKILSIMVHKDMAKSVLDKIIK